jgi:hypothetical protein
MFGSMVVYAGFTTEEQSQHLEIRSDMVGIFGHMS